MLKEINNEYMDSSKNQVVQRNMSHAAISGVKEPSLLEALEEDLRFEESLKACMNCGICTAICPAASFFDYDPRQLCIQVQTHDEGVIEQLLKSDTIWQCGQCMSCKPRCPRGNTPGVLIQVLRKVSQDRGYFVESELGRLQYDVVVNVGNNLYETGYCVTPDLMIPPNHPEQGPVWEWLYDNREDVLERVGAAYKKDTVGALRTLSEETMDELHSIFDVTGGFAWMEKIRNYSMPHPEE